MQDFAPFTPELLGALSAPKTPGHTASQPHLQVEGPLHVVEGY
jgi:hypothetical protein